MATLSTPTPTPLSPPLALPVLSLASPADDFAAQIGASFRQYGFALVADHGIDAALIDRAWRLTAELFALDPAEKARCDARVNHGARGYTAFGTERAVGAKAADLKEFWHVGRDLPAGHRLSASMAANLWPDRPEGFRECFTTLFAEFDRVGGVIASRIAVALGLAADWFEGPLAEGNSVLRLLHYPPVAAEREGALRAAPHEDINLITLLLGAEEAGLELLTREGEWLPANPPPGALVVNVGDMLQRLTNHTLPSTTHRVRNPDDTRSGMSRYSMPFFVHLRSDFMIETLPECVGDGAVDRYPQAISADDFLQERLRAIGLKR